MKWWDVSWNPVTGCTPISEGCQNCYARMMANRWKKVLSKYRNNFETTLHPEELKRKFAGKGKKIFVCSMSDLFHDEVPDEFIFEVFCHALKNQQHTFFFLTKRPERLVSLADKIIFTDNIWVGVTCENNKHLDRLDLLRMIRCNRFVSFEPLLEDVSEKVDLAGIDWVIAGRETGGRARLCLDRYFFYLEDKCREEHIPMFFKQSPLDHKKGYDCEFLTKLKQFPKGVLGGNNRKNRMAC